MTRVRLRRRCGGCTARERHRAGMFREANARRADRWTREEQELLRLMAGRYTAAQIGERLGRSADAVHVRAHLLGVYLQTEDWTLHRLSRLFGAWEPTIERAWIRSGMLQARKLGPGEHCRRGEWRIREADVERFILDYPWAYDAAVMVPQSHRLAQLARRVQQREGWLVGAEAIGNRLGISAKAVFRWTAAGLIPHYRRAIGQGARSGHLVMREGDLDVAREAIARRHAAWREERRQRWLGHTAARKAQAQERVA
jgi:DNA-binding CsgD family transcriptional regulator